MHAYYELIAVKGKFDKNKFPHLHYLHLVSVPYSVMTTV